MIVVKLTLDLYGKSFIPTKLVDLINDKVHINYLDDSYNFVSLEKPFTLGINQDLLANEKVNTLYSEIE